MLPNKHLVLCQQALIDHEPEASPVQICYAAPTVPRKAHFAFSETCAALQRVVDAAAENGQDVGTAQQELLLLPSRLRKYCVT
jgi:hypothetical protein